MTGQGLSTGEARDHSDGSQSLIDQIRVPALLQAMFTFCI